MYPHIHAYLCMYIHTHAVMLFARTHAHMYVYTRLQLNPPHKLAQELSAVIDSRVEFSIEN